MRKMSAQVESVVSAYKQLSKIPTVVSARLSKGGKKVSSRWSVRNLDRSKLTYFAYNYTLDSELNVVAESEYGTDVSNELLSCVSPSERFRAVIRECANTKESKKQYLEVWQARTLAHSIELNALELHGDVYADSEFKSLDWSPDESSIVYVAERKLPKSEPYIKRKPAKDESKGSDGGDTPLPQGEEYSYKQDWGEQLVGKHLSVIAVCKLDTETVTIVPGLPETDCPGQVKWSPDGQSLVGVAWETEPRRLGLIFCTNRPSYVFALTLDGELRKISSTGMAVRSPRFVGDRLVWLQRSAGGPHHACHQIVCTSWPIQHQPKVDIVVDIVATKVKTSNGVSFHGVYSQVLPGRCSSSDGRLVFSTQQRRTVRSYVVDISAGRMVDITDNSFPGCTTVLDVQGDTILASRTNLTHPSQGEANCNETLYTAAEPESVEMSLNIAQLIVGKLPEAGMEQNIFWRSVSSSIEMPASLKSSLIHYLDLQHEGTQDSVTKFSAIYFGPAATEGQRLPLVVWPHGGPHSGFVDAYSLEPALFVMLGFACLQINYRGSVGDGQASVDFLPSRVGTADVHDCKLATDEALKRFPVDPKKLCLFGGSHGGFLVTHLSGQYPDFFSKVVTRNPVIDVAGMFNTTDIPDWCAVEAGYDFTEAGAASEEQLLGMRRASPLAHVHKVRAPTALMLGSVDKRVPYYQGLEYHRRLKANGCVTKLYLYEDNHSLSSLAVEMDNLINSVLWFSKYMQ